MKNFIWIMLVVLINFTACKNSSNNDNSTSQNPNNRQGKGNQGNDGGGFYVVPTLPAGTSTGEATYSASGFNIQCGSASTAQNIMQLSLQTTKASDGNSYNTVMYFDSACVNSAQITVSPMSAGDVATLTVTIKSLDGSEVLLSGTTAAYTQQAAPSPSPDPSSGGYGQFQRQQPTEVDITMTGSLGEQLAFAGILNQSVNVCGALVIQSEDISGNALAASNQITINLSSSSSTGTFYSDSSGCSTSTAITSIIEPVSAASVTVYYKDSTIGSPTLTATDAAGASGLAAGSETAQINPALAFTGNALSQNTSVCGPLTIEAQDASGNVFSLSSAITISLNTSSSSGNFYSDNACTAQISSSTIAVSTSDLTVYYEDTVAGSYSLTVSSAGMTSATMNATIMTASSSTTP